MISSTRILAAAATFAVVPWLATPAAATPISSPTALQNTLAPSIETVQYRRGWGGGYRGGPYRGGVYRGGYRGGGYGGVGLGLAAGALLGGAIIGAAQQPYGYYGSGYAHAPGYVAVAPYGGGDATAYCLQRFRSYDPRSGSYLGFDGFRHPCP